MRAAGGDLPDVEVLAGGGVRGPDDLDRLRRCGVRGVLVQLRPCTMAG